MRTIPTLGKLSSISKQRKGMEAIYTPRGPFIILLGRIMEAKYVRVERRPVKTELCRGQADLRKDFKLKCSGYLLLCNESP